MVLIGILPLTGCAHHYVLKLTNGTQITTATKPKLVDGVYHFKDAKGEEHAVAISRVREIAPASMAERESKGASTKPQSEKKRHWYLLWLG